MEGTDSFDQDSLERDGIIGSPGRITSICISIYYRIDVEKHKKIPIPLIRNMYDVSGLYHFSNVTVNIKLENICTYTVYRKRGYCKKVGKQKRQSLK